MTIAQSNTLVQFDAALRAAAARATAVYPAEHARIDRGLAIALTDGVTLCPDGTAAVASQSQPRLAYTVNGHCTCKDVAHAPAGRCKHRWAKALYKAALATVRRHPGPERWWATYYAPDGAAIPGVAVWCVGKQCYLFIPEDGQAPLYPALQALCLGGHIPTAEAQRVQDGDLVRKVCGY